MNIGERVRSCRKAYRAGFVAGRHSAQRAECQNAATNTASLKLPDVDEYIRAWYRSNGVRFGVCVDIVRGYGEAVARQLSGVA